MYPELNGNNNPPTVTKRKKKREKKHTSASEIEDCNIPPYNGFASNLNPYPPNLTLPESSSFYPFFNYPTSTEPMSLPVYPSNYHNYTFPSNPNVNYPNKIGYPWFPSGESTDYMSLPLANMDQTDNKRRFSDPGPNDSSSESDASSNDSHIIRKLTQQVYALKESNSKLTRDVGELKMEVNLLKQQQASKHYEREYEPGMIAEFIRDLREAARVREDALIARVKHMIEEKQLSMNQFQVVAEKSRNNDRLSKLEEQIKNLSLNHSRSEDNISLPSSSTLDDGGSSAHQVIELEREALLLRRELQDARAKKEESDQKWQQLDKKLSHLLRRKNTSASEASEESKTASTVDTYSVGTPSPGQVSQRVTLSGPVTDL